jgi:hypothetical protein
MKPRPVFTLDFFLPTLSQDDLRELRECWAPLWRNPHCPAERLADWLVAVVDAEEARRAQVAEGELLEPSMPSIDLGDGWDYGDIAAALTNTMTATYTKATTPIIGELMDALCRFFTVRACRVLRQLQEDLVAAGFPGPQS